MNRLQFTKEVEEDGSYQYYIYNDKKEHLGYLYKHRVGAWMTWVFEGLSDCYFSASCLDEIRAKQKELNAIKKGSIRGGEKE